MTDRPRAPRRSRLTGLAVALLAAAAGVLAGCPTAERRPAYRSPTSHRIEAGMDGDEAFTTSPSSSGTGHSYGISGEVD